MTSDVDNGYTACIPFGGAYGVCDPELLTSALAMPSASFEGSYLHADIYQQAAAYALHICQNHPFVDGNKRTALATAIVFLDLNGIEIEDPLGADEHNKSSELSP